MAQIPLDMFFPFLISSHFSFLLRTLTSPLIALKNLDDDAENDESIPLIVAEVGNDESIRLIVAEVRKGRVHASHSCRGRK
jgi:hypothetical protein